MRVARAVTEDQIAAARELFLEYATSLEIDLEFQSFTNEMSRFPEDYAAPSGALLLGELEGRVVGCVGIRRLGGKICEMKRLYVKPGYRQRGLGRALAEEGVKLAREMGYRRIRLDTLASMQVATALYRALGFAIIAPYRHNPIAEATFMELRLD